MNKNRYPHSKVAQDTLAKIGFILQLGTSNLTSSISSGISKGTVVTIGRLSLFAVIFLLFYPTLGRCQVQTGQPANAANATPIPSSGHDYIHLLSETVDPASGSVNIRVNFGTPKGRGITLPAAYVYNSSNVYSITQDATSGVIQFEMSDLMGQNDFALDGPFPVATWSESGWQQPPTIEGTGGTEIYYSYCNYATSFTFKAPDGVSHNLGLFVGTVGVNGPSANQNDCANGATASGTDGQVTAAFASTSTTLSDVGHWPVSTGDDPPVNGPVGAFTVTDAAGTTYFFSGTASYISSENVWQEEAYKIEDRNGNEITANTGNCGAASSSEYCDTLLRPVVSSSGNTVTVGGVSYTLSNGNAGMATINYTVPETGGSLTGGSNTVACPTTQWTVSASGSNSVAGEQIIILPDGTNYTLYLGNYNPTDSSVENNYGLINEIIYPDGGWVKYTWEMSPDYAESATFMGTYLQGPNEGQPAENGCEYEYSTPVVATRQVSFDGKNVAQRQTFSYSTTWVNDAWTSKSTSVTTTDEITGKSALTQYTYTPGYIAAPPSVWGSTATAIPLEQTVTRYDWGNTTTPLDTETKAWYSISGGEPQLACDFHTSNSGQVTGHFYQYEYDQISDDKEYGAGQIANAAVVCQGDDPTAPEDPTPDRETAITFQAFTNPLGAVFGKPSIVTVYGNGTQASQTTYGYDQTAVSVASATNHDESNFGANLQTERGNLTSVTQAGTTTTYTYDETGQVMSSTDANGNQTTYSYTDNPNGGNATGNSNAYVTAITNALGQTENFTYDYTDGNLLSEEDVNQKTTTYSYNDPLDRLTNISYPDTGSTAILYDDSVPSVTMTRTLGDSEPSETNAKIFDGMGHVVQTQLTSAPQGEVYEVYVDTLYDGDGRVYQQSNPTRCASVPGTLPASCSEPTYGITTYSYDALGRPTIQTQQDGSTLQWCYNDVGGDGQSNCSANKSSASPYSWVDFTDENGNEWQRTYDALGRLVEVEEPNGSSQAPSMVTDYSYDALGDLLRVDQWGGPSGGSGDRVRTFSYDSLGRLLSASNPESGTVSYTYDADGNVLTKTDARGVTTNYKYDALNRLLSKTYSAGTSADPTDTPVSCYEYDTSSSAFSGFSPTNLVGRLSNEWTQPSGKSCSSSPESGNYITLDAFSYDPMGRVLTEEQCTPANCTASTPYNMTYTYDLAGDVTSSTNGLATTPGSSGAPLTFTYAWNGAQWLQGITSNWSTTNPAYPPQLMSVGSFWPTGAVWTMTYGNGLSLTRTYDNRLRITGETDQGSVRASATPGTATITISGSDQSQ